MGKLEGRLVLVLDLDRILSPVEVQSALDAVATETITNNTPLAAQI